MPDLYHTIRVMLDDEHFAALVRGKVVKISVPMTVTVQPSGNPADDHVKHFTQNVEIALSDIGFDRMDRHLDEAERELREASQRG